MPAITDTNSTTADVATSAVGTISPAANNYGTSIGVVEFNTIPADNTTQGRVKTIAIGGGGSVSSTDFSVIGAAGNETIQV